MAILRCSEAGFNLRTQLCGRAVFARPRRPPFVHSARCDANVVERVHLVGSQRKDDVALASVETISRVFVLGEPQAVGVDSGDSKNGVFARNPRRILAALFVALFAALCLWEDPVEMSTSNEGQVSSLSLPSMQAECVNTNETVAGFILSSDHADR